VVRNAIRYTEPGSAVEIEFVRAGQEAVVRVSDRGPGIPEAQLRQIFEPFHRIDHARSMSTGGFGVGLAITDRSVRLHQGTVRARNRVGGGTVVEIRLPC